MHVSWVAAGEWRSRQALGKKEDVSKGTGGRGVKQTLEKEGAVHGAGQQAGEERGVVHGEGSNVILLPMLFFLGVMSASRSTLQLLSISLLIAFFHGSPQYL